MPTTGFRQFETLVDALETDPDTQSTFGYPPLLSAKETIARMVKALQTIRPWRPENRVNNTGEDPWEEAWPYKAYRTINETGKTFGQRYREWHHGLRYHLNKLKDASKLELGN
jgi:hypothetical protein